MKEKMMTTYLRGKRFCTNAVKNFFREEKGASDIVAIIVIIVVVIAVAGIFRTQLTDATNRVFGQLSEFIGE